MKEERKTDDEKIVLPWSKIRLGCFSIAWHITWPRGLLRFGGKCRRIYDRIILPCSSLLLKYLSRVSSQCSMEAFDHGYTQCPRDWLWSRTRA